MKRENFISDLTEALAAFMGDQLLSSESRFSFLGVKPKLGVGKEGTGKEKLSLVLLDVSTSAKAVDSAYDRMQGRDGTYSVTVRTPWQYLARYALVGPSLQSKEGMKEAGKVHALFFDFRKLPDEYLHKCNLEFLDEVEITPASAAEAEERQLHGFLNRDQGILLSFNAKFMYATGTEVAKDKKVAQREIRAGLRDQQL